MLCALRVWGAVAPWVELAGRHGQRAVGLAWGAAAGPAFVVLQRYLHPQSQRRSLQGTSHSSSTVCRMEAPISLKSQGPALHLDLFQHCPSVNAGGDDPGGRLSLGLGPGQSFPLCIHPHVKRG